MAATCMAVCKGSRKKIRGIFISSCHLPAAVECDIVILSEPGPNPTGPSWAVLQTQLIPARGRKRGRSFARSCGCHDTTYPREGTETITLYRDIKSNIIGHNLSPRGDGNSLCSSFILLFKDTTYPREGTETSAFWGPPSWPWTQLIPARGRKQIISVLPDIK